MLHNELTLSQRLTYAMISVRFVHDERIIMNVATNNVCHRGDISSIHSSNFKGTGTLEMFHRYHTCVISTCVGHG